MPGIAQVPKARARAKEARLRPGHTTGMLQAKADKSVRTVRDPAILKLHVGTSIPSRSVRKEKEREAKDAGWLESTKKKKVQKS